MRLRNFRWTLIPIVLLAPVACKSRPTDGTTSTTAKPPAPPPAPPPLPPRPPASATAQPTPEHRFSGPTGMLFTAARELQLKDEQKTTITKLEEDLKNELQKLQSSG